jgi:hypothetical protein
MSEKGYLQIVPYGRTDDVRTISVELDVDLSTEEFFLGKTIYGTVIGIERASWTGKEVH